MGNSSVVKVDSRAPLLVVKDDNSEARSWVLVVCFRKNRE